MIMGLDNKKIIPQYISSEDKSKLSEGSKRVKLHPRTLSDIERMSEILWKASVEKDDDVPQKGFIKVIDPTGGDTDVPVYYLSELPAQGGMFPIDKDKPRNIYNSFIVVNPSEAINPGVKNTYNILYHEVQHLMDLSTTQYLSDKMQKGYSAEMDDDSLYWGHEFEFRAYSNEILNSIYNEYKDLFGKFDKEDLDKSLDSMLKFFGQGGPLDDIGIEVVFKANSEQKDEKLPHMFHVLKKIKKHNPGKWNNFLKMLYSTTQDLKKEMNDYYQETLVKEYKKPRKYGESYCKRTPCQKMGFSQKASCRPYKNCYRRG